MSDVPPPPQVSPDGKFYWDGTRWVPMPTAAAPEPPASVPSQGSGGPQAPGWEWKPPPPQIHSGHTAGMMPAVAAKRSYPGRPIVIGCLGLIVLIGLGICAVGVFGGGSYNLKGTLEVNESVSVSPCTGTGGYSDIHAGTEVTVRDASGKLLATAQLDSGSARGVLACIFPFEVTVPDADFYQIEVSHRGEVSFSKSDMQRLNWSVDLTLG